AERAELRARERFLDVIADRLARSAHAFPARGVTRTKLEDRPEQFSGFFGRAARELGPTGERNRIELRLGAERLTEALKGGRAAARIATRGGELEVRELSAPMLALDERLRAREVGDHRDERGRRIHRRACARIEVKAHRALGLCFADAILGGDRGTGPL